MKHLEKSLLTLLDQSLQGRFYNAANTSQKKPSFRLRYIKLSYARSLGFARL